MQGNFSYHNPTKLYFGDESLNYLKDELNNYGPVVLLNYGSGSVKRNGIYDQVVAILKEAGKTIVENPGVMSNPTLEKLREGIKIARENNVDWILALGGGSVCDYSKAVAASVFYDGDSVGAWTHAPHGYCLAAVSMAYYRRAMKPGLAKFVRFAKNVWDIKGNGMTDEQIAEAGLEALKNWMLEIGLPLTISELMEQREQSQTGLNSAESRQKKTEGQIGATPDMIPGITEGTICYPAGYMDLKPEDITEILKESM